MGLGTLRGCLLAVGLFAVALAGRFALAPVLPPLGFPFLTFFPAVLLATYFAGLGPGLLTGLLSILAAWFFFIEPYGSFALKTTADRIALVFFISIILIDILVIHRMNAAVARLADEQQRSARLAEELRRLNTLLEERVRQEVAAREAAHVKLAQDQRLRALGQLAGGVAHDFNNVMQAVQSGASLIRRRAESPEAVRHLAQMVEEATRRGASVTRRLLAFAKRGEMRLEPVDPARLLGGLREIFWHTLGTHIEIRIDVAPQLPVLLTDPGQLETVLVNLATNARDAMPRGGILTIGARSETLSPDRAAALGLADGPCVTFTVRDTGEGMSAEVLARAGEPFFSTKAVGSGTGLGLAMARGFVEQSGGALEIESAPGVGTAVTIRLPAATPDQLGEEVQPLPLPAPRRRRVLLVDDDALVRDFLAESLGEEGYPVVRASSGAGALALLAAGEEPDFLVTDCEMAGMDGLALLDAARAVPAFTRLPTILLTGKVEHGLDKVFAERMAADPLLRILHKPVGVEELTRELALLEQQGRAS
ncbi:hybrid sensor histidine kinase/response regulator [Falsiroseomonas sp.]|uniref:hybrid sensor histidine kinase/response regulator n=1 Tax=Falsiroseomonas sp. TaxID=2870721 RepID=UPI003F712958